MIAKRNLLVSVLFALIGMQSVQAQVISDPAEVVRRVTTDVLTVVQQHRRTYDSNPTAYFNAIDTTVSTHVNFERMAYLVMDATYYRASTAEQRARFVEVFHKSLIQTYSKGLLSVDQLDFTVLPVEAAADAQTVTVKQELRSGSNKFNLDYSVRKEPDGRWLLVNVVVDGINLGSTFRNQFALSARKFSDNLDLVIDAWASNN